MSNPQIRPGEAGTTGASTYRLNAAWCQGVGIGYWCTKGSGLTLNIAAGVARDSSNVPQSYAGGTLTMANNATNYVEVDPATGAPSSNTTGFTSGQIAIATVVTASGAISTIDDQRTMFFSGGGGPVPLTVEFYLNDGSVATSAVEDFSLKVGTVSTFKVLVRASDATTDLTIDIKKNGTTILTAPVTIAHGTAADTLVDETSSLDSPPISVAVNDKFRIDITSGTGDWKFVAKLET